MKKIVLLSFIVSIISSCTSEKGEVAIPIIACVTDTTIDVINLNILDYSYSPQTVDILVGDTILWTNAGPSPHTVTCDGSAGTVKPIGAPSFDSGIGTPIGVGGTFKAAMSVAGNYTYICLYHTGMSGTIVVKPRCQ